MKMKCASLGLKQSGSREELIMRIEEATHESEEEPDVIAEDAEKAVHRTFEGKKARKKQWSGGRDSRTIRAEKEFAQKEKERLARATSRRAMKLQREMFERWRMEAREKRKEREESRDVEREVKELNERMGALQKQFEKEKEQWKEEETRIANAHEAKLEEFTLSLIHI